MPEVVDTARSEGVQVASLGGALQNTAMLLMRDILGSALSSDDKRYEAAENLMVRAVWKGYWEREEMIPGFGDATMKMNEFTDFLSEIEGRVLTVIESVFPPGQQCQALKSLARQEVWETRKRVSIE